MRTCGAELTVYEKHEAWSIFFLMHILTYTLIEHS